MPAQKVEYEEVMCTCKNTPCTCFNVQEMLKAGYTIVDKYRLHPFAQCIKMERVPPTQHRKVPDPPKVRTPSKMNSCYVASWRARLYDQVITTMGGICNCCGTTENLLIDHIRAKITYDPPWQKASGVHLAHLLARHGYPPGFQVLCRACNSSKGRGDKCLIHNKVFA